MKAIEEMRSVEELEERVEEICRHRPDLRTLYQNGDASLEARAADIKLDLVCKAQERIRVLRAH